MNRLLLTKIWLILLTLGLIFFTPTSHGVFCLPADPSVAAGSATFSTPNPNTLQIDASNQAIINYGSFNIGQGESVIIQLPSLDSSILNRVLGSGASDLLGNLSCNGLFILVNQNGIFIGPNAFINVGSFIASTRNITDSNFLSSQYVFERMSEEQLDMLLRNQGTITVRDGGFGVLIAGAVENQGTIIAKVGTIALAGGDKVTLNMAGDSLISVAIDTPTAATIIDKDGKPITDQIKNSGTLQADGGMVVLKDASLPGIFINAINLQGYVTANKFDERSGKIVVLTERDVLIDATLEATEIIIGKADEAVPENVNLAGGSLTAEESVTVLAKNDIKTSADITAEAGDVRLFADYDGDGAGEFTQQAGVIEAKGNGNVYVDGSGTMTLGEIRTENGTINIGTQRAPDAIAGEPKYVHTSGDITIIEKETANNIATLKTDRGDVLKYNPTGKLTLEATQGLIQDLTLTPLTADYLKLIANGFIVNSSALTTELYKNTGDLVIRSSTLQDSNVALEGEGINVTYLKDNNITLRSDNAVRTNPGVIIQAAQVKVIANQFGTMDVPLNVQANNTYITRLNGNIDIMESLGLGSSIMLRGPPDGFGYISYSSSTNLYLDAQSVNLLGTNPTYLYGNITFNNFNCTVPGKEIYFEAGKLYTILGTFRIEGAYAQHIRLLSLEYGKQWFIDPQGARDISYAWAQDSYNVNPLKIMMTESTGRENNFNWDPIAFWIYDGATPGNWSEPANWSGLGGGETPGASDDVVFNAAHIGDSLIDAEWNAGTINSLTVAAGYAGTISMSRSLTITNTYRQNSGTFNTNGNSLNIGSLDILGGTLNAGSSIITCGENWSVPGTDNFNFGDSMVIFNNDIGVQTLDGGILGSITANFHNLTHSGAGTLQLINNTLLVADTFLNSNGTFDGNTEDMYFAGDWTNSGSATFTRGAGILAFNGTTTLTDSSSNTQNLGAVIIPGTVTLGSSVTMTSASGIGTLNLGAGGYTLNLSGTGSPLAVTNFSKGTGSTINYAGTGGIINVRQAPYHNLSFNPTVAATYYLSGDLTGINALSGSLTIGANATLDVQNSFLPIIYNIELAGDWTTSGTFLCRTGTVIFNNTTAKQNLNPGLSNFHDLIISNSHLDGAQLNSNPLNTDTVTIIPLGTLDIQNLGMSGVILNVNGILKLIGSQIVNFAVVTSAVTGTVDYYGGENYTTLAVGPAYHHLTISGGGTYDLTLMAVAAIGVGGNLTISDGILDLSGVDLVMTAAGVFDNHGTLRLRGDEALTFFANDTTSGTIEFDGAGGYIGPWGGTGKLGAPLTGLAAGQSYYDILFSGAGSWTTDDSLDISNGFAMTNGTLNTAFDITVGGSWNNSAVGSFNPTVPLQKVDFDGNGLQILNTGGMGVGKTFTNLTYSGTGTLRLTDDLSVTTNLIINGAGGTFDAGTADKSITVGSLFSVDDATFTGPDSPAAINTGNLAIGAVSVGGTTIFNAGTAPINIGIDLFISGGAPGGPTTFTAGNSAAGGVVTVNGSYLSGGTPTVDWTANDGKLYLQSDTNQTLPVNLYHHLELDNNLGLLTTYTLGGNTRLEGNLDIDSGAALTVINGLNNFNLNLAGNWNNDGVFVAGTGLVTFDGGTANITTGGIGAGKIFNNVEINSLGFTKTLVSDINIDGNFTITNGTFDTGGSDMYVAGNWDSGGIFNARTGTVTFDGAGVQNITSNSRSFYNLIVNGAGAAPTLLDNMSITGNLNAQKGTLVVSTYNLAVTGNSTVTGVGGAALLTIGASADTGWTTTNLTIGANGTVTCAGNSKINIGGSSDISAGAFNRSTSTITFTATSPGKTIKSGFLQYYNLTFSGSGGEWALQDDVQAVNGILSFTSGTLHLNGKTFWVGLAQTVTVGNGFTLDVGTGTFTFNVNNVHLTVPTGGTLTISTGTIDTTDLTVSGTGTFTNSGASSLRIVGNINITSPNWNPGQSTIMQYSGTPTLSSTQPLYNYQVAWFNVDNCAVTLNSDLTVQNNFTILTHGGNHTFSAGTHTIAVGGNWTNGDTFNCDASTVNLNGSGAQDITSNSQPFYSFKVNKNAGSAVLFDPLFAANDLIVQQGTLNAAGFNITLGGDWTVSDSAHFISGANTVNFNGTDPQLLDSGGTDADHDFADVICQGATIRIIDHDLTINGTLRLTGTPAHSSFDLSYENRSITIGDLIINDGEFFAPDGSGTMVTINGDCLLSPVGGPFAAAFYTGGSADALIAGNFTIGNGGLPFAHFASGSGTITVNGVYSNNNPGNIDWITNHGKLYLQSDTNQTLPVNAYYHLELDDNGGGATIYTLSSDTTLGGNLNIDAGATLDTASSDLNIAGTAVIALGGVLNLNGIIDTSTLTISNTLTNNGALVITDGTNTVSIVGTGTRRTFTGNDINYNGRSVTLTNLDYDPDVNLAAAGDTIVLGDSNCLFDSISIGAGTTFNAGARSFAVSGNFSKAALGTLITAGTITFNGNGHQNITSNNQIYNNILITNPSRGTVEFTDSFTTANFTDVTPGSGLIFTAGSTATITGTLNLRGAKGNPVYLDNQGGSDVRFNLDVSGAAQNVYYVNVSHSEALTNNITAYNSVDGGNNDTLDPSPHWVFVTDIEPPNDPIVNNPFDYGEGEWLKKKYPKGKYRTTVIVFEGKVVVAPYDERGVRYDEATVLTGGQKIAVEDWVK